MESHQKGFLKLKYFSPLKILTSPLFEETLGTLPLFFSFFLLFFSLSLFFLSSPSLEDSGVLMIFEEKITSSKTSFQMASIHWWWTHIPKWSYAHQHS
jgi:hypothetical protein